MRICFYVGYTPPFNGINFTSQKVYGSETCVIYLAERYAAQSTNDVFIFVHGIKDAQMELVHNNVHYVDAALLHTFEDIELMIVSRYIHFFIYYKVLAKQTFFWIHDSVPNYMYEGKPLHDLGKHLLYNLCKAKVIDKIIFVSEWQKNNSCSHYNFVDVPLYVIPNGIPQDMLLPYDMISHNPQRIPFRFLFNADPSRGLEFALSCFHLIQQSVPIASIVLFRKEEFTPKIIKMLSQLHNVTCYGKVPPKVVKDELSKTDVWFYPTFVPETFCICALEAQANGALCVSTDIGGLAHTIGRFGIRFPSSATVKNVVNGTLRLLQDKHATNNLRLAAWHNASSLTWNNIFSIWNHNVLSIESLIVDHIQNNKPIAFLKYGDGHYFCMKGYKGKTCDNENYTQDLQHKLISAFDIAASCPYAYLGLWRHYTELRYYLSKLPDNWNRSADFCTFIIDDLHTLSQQPKKQLYSVLRTCNRQKIFIGPEFIKQKTISLLQVSTYITIHPNDWFALEYDDIYNKCIEACESSSPIFFLSAGMGAKVLASDLITALPSASIIDIGSAFDFICGAKISRKYQGKFSYSDFAHSISSTSLSLVVSYFDESLDWISNEWKYDGPVYVYSKLHSSHPYYNLISLPNVGRESHTYLHHIINNFDSLSDIVVFSLGSCNNGAFGLEKLHKFRCVMNHLYEVSYRGIVQYDGQYGSKQPFSPNFTLSKYNNNELTPAVVRPFGLWYQTYIRSDLSKIESLGVGYNAIFATTKEQIHRYPLTFYQNLYSQLVIDKELEVGHFFERTWLSLFHRD